jgi:tetratricopeptide (TPR) repeat protein
MGLALSPATAFGQAPGADKTEDPSAMARRFFNSGQKAFAEGRFTDAAKAFEEAYRIKPHPAPLINAGDAWEKAGEYAQAARTYQRVLEMDEATEQDRADAVDRLSRLNPKLGIIELIGEQSLRARVDDDEFRGGSRVYVFPGEHKVTLVDVDGAKVRTLDVAAGTTRSVDLGTLRPGEKDQPEETAAARPIDSTPDGTEQRGGIRPLTWVAFGVGAVGVAGAVYFGLQVNDAEQSYNDDPNRDDLDRFNQNKLFTNVSLGVAAVGVGVGTFFLIQDLGKKKKPAEPVGMAPVDAVPLPGGAMFVGRGRF